MSLLILVTIFLSTVSLHAEEILTPSAEIYVPSPQFKDLNRPTTSILDLPPIKTYSGSPGIVAPGAYNHYQYLYFQPYNYRMQSYPYMYYQGQGQRDPGYFNWTSSQKTKSDNPQRFEGARIINAPSKAKEDAQGQIEGPKFLAYWVQTVGVSVPPPVPARDQVTAYLNTKPGSDPRIIKSVKAIESKGKIVRIDIRYEPQKDSKAKFYDSQSDSESKGMLSVAIFKKFEVPIRFIDESKDPKEDDKSTDPSAFIDEGFLSCEVWNMSRFRRFTSSNVINGGIRSKADLSDYELFLELPDRVKAKMRNVDFEKEIIYLTGRAYSSQAKAADLFDRRIKRVANIDSSSNEQLVDIDESTTSQEPLNREDLEDDSKLWFRGHYIVVEKSRNNSKPKFVLNTAEASN